MGREGERLTTWELLIQDQLELQGQSNWQIRCYQSVQSTMEAAHDLVRESQPRRGMALASSQLAGRGRRGSSWLSADQGFYCTYIFQASVQVKNLVGFSLVAGLAVCEMCERLGCALGVKWPNDVLDKSARKLCGVLIEVSSYADRHYLLAGIGLNIDGAPFGVEAISLADMCGKRPPASQIASDLAQLLDRDFSLFEAGGFKLFQQSWLSKALYLGRDCEIQQGERTLKGKFIGVGEEGQLLLQVDGGTVAVVSGHPIFGA